MHTFTSSVRIIDCVRLVQSQERGDGIADESAPRASCASVDPAVRVRTRLEFQGPLAL
jgi:hypothetical protein